MRSAHGTIIKRNGTPIAHVRNITLPQLSRQSYDVTRRGDTDDRYKLGIRNFGELSFDANLVMGDSTIAGLLTAWRDATEDEYEIDWVDGAVWNFSGYVSKVTTLAPVDGLLAANFTIRPSVAVSFDEVLLMEDGDDLLLESGDKIEL